LHLLPLATVTGPHITTRLQKNAAVHHSRNCAMMSQMGLGRVKTFSCKSSKLEEVATRAIFPDFDYALIAAISG
jgi:hypothetical protein